jgi:hypothetical protein
MANPSANGQTATPITRFLHSLTRDLRGIYRPERHYMRGPGPKWHEKHPPVSEPPPATMQPSKATV